MTITNGQNADASDFVSTSSGAGDAGKAVKLDSAGKINPNMQKKFGCRLFGSSSSVPNSGLSAMSFPSESFDDDTMHENVTNPSRITFKTAGYWMVGGAIHIGGTASSGPIGVTIRLNGTSNIGAGGGALYAGAGGACTMRHFDLNDYVELFGISPSSAGSGSGDDKTNFWAILLQAD